MQMVNIGSAPSEIATTPRIGSGSTESRFRSHFGIYLAATTTAPDSMALKAGCGRIPIAA